MSTEPLPSDWTRWTAERLALEIADHNRRYWDDNAPSINDYDYDALVERLRTLDPDAPILKSMGPSSQRTMGTPVTHDAPMLSLDKAYDEATLLHWASKFQGELVMTPKVDGVACSIRYDAQGRFVLAATRGNGTVGEDISINVKGLVDVPERIASAMPVEVRGEVYLPISAFEALEGDFANPRNTAAGALRQKTPGRARAIGLRFFAYDLLGPTFETETQKNAQAAEWGFSTVENRVVSRSEVQSGYDAYVARRAQLDYEIDGVVFKANRLDEQARLGATAHHPRYAIAYKLQGESATTILKEVEWSVSRTGALTPVGIVEPVVLSGATVTRISLHNWGLVQSKNLTLNARVVAMRRGGVIPHLENVVEPGNEMIFPPTSCPSCDARPVIQNEFILCDNRTSCPAQSVGVLAHYAKVTDIEGFGQVWLDTLVEAGVLRTPSDFYRLTRGDLLRFDRMGEVLADKLLDQISAQRTIGLATFLQALGISDLGKTASHTVAETFQTLDTVRSATTEDFLSLPKFGDILAQRMPHRIAQASGMIDALLAFVTVEDAVPQEPVSGPLDGQSFLFTGTLTQMSRNDAQDRVRALGGQAASGVSKTLTYLVVGDAGKAGSKLKKAQAAGVSILSESEFMTLILGAS